MCRRHGLKIKTHTTYNKLRNKIKELVYLKLICANHVLSLDKFIYAHSLLRILLLGCSSCKVSNSSWRSRQLPLSHFLANIFKSHKVPTCTMKTFLGIGASHFEDIYEFVYRNLNKLFSAKKLLQNTHIIQINFNIPIFWKALIIVAPSIQFI